LTGRRAKMEDFHIEEQVQSLYYLYGIFDGHSGKLSSKYVSRILPSILQNLFLKSSSSIFYNPTLLIQTLEESFHLTQKRLFQNLNPLLKDHPLQLENDQHLSGSTATLSMIMKNDLLVSVNIGDSSAVLCCEKVKRSFIHSYEYHPFPLTVDHNPYNPKEEERIRRRGGVVMENGGILRVEGKLAITRSFGDLEFSHLLSVNPSISILQFKHQTNLQMDGDEKDSKMKSILGQEE